MMQTVASQIPVEIINQAVAQLIGDKNLVISVSGPEKEDIAYPTKDELVALSNEIKAEEIEPYREEFPMNRWFPIRPHRVNQNREGRKFGTTV